MSTQYRLDLLRFWRIISKNEDNFDDLLADTLNALYDRGLGNLEAIIAGNIIKAFDTGMNRQLPGRKFHPLASCTLVVHQQIVVGLSTWSVVN